MDFVRNNLLLIALAVVSGAMLVWPLLRRGAGGPWVSTLEATHLINRQDAIVIDLRDAAEYSKGHILGARSVPLADLERRLGELTKFKSRPVILSCESGGRSGNAIAVLRRSGFTNVHNLSGGVAAWQQAGLPVEK
jgi:rhodanese-related sulfurtransferase